MDEEKKNGGGLSIYVIGFSWILYASLFGLHSPLSFLLCTAFSILMNRLVHALQKKAQERKAAREAEKQKAAEEKRRKAEEKAAAKREALEKKKQKNEPPPAPETTGDTDVDELLRQGKDFCKELERLDDDIPDLEVSAKLKQIESLLELILNAVKREPVKKKQIRQTMNYYMPTTIKLVNHYVVLQEQKIGGENIEEGMEKISAMLDSVVTALKKQLDGLFEADVVDITADIRVMEKKLVSEGLTEQHDF